MIEVRGLTKRSGDVLAVDDLSFVVEPGLVTCFLGPNGAGNSTTMPMMLRLDRPSAGEALVNGRRFAAYSEPLREVGALLDPGHVHPGRSGLSTSGWQRESPLHMAFRDFVRSSGLGSWQPSSLSHRPVASQPCTRGWSASTRWGRSGWG